MATVELSGEIRTAVGKAAAKRFRRNHRIPGIVYGGPRGPVAVTLNPQELATALGSGENVLINLSLAGADGPQSRMVILKSLQLDPVKGRALHADFLEVSMEKKIRVEIPLVLTGEAVGVKSKGGILEQSLRQVFVECLPLNIPERFTVDVSGLDVGNAAHVRDLSVGEGIRILEDLDRVVASVVAPEAVEVAAPAEEEKLAEPEVVGKKEKEEAEAEAEAKPEGKAKPEAKTK